MSDDTTPPDETADATPEPKPKNALRLANEVDALIFQKHATELAASCIATDFAIRAGVRSTDSADDVEAALGWKRREGGGGLLFPFIDYDSGSKLLTRVKPDKPRTRTTAKGKVRVIKYEQAPGTGAVPYIGPNTRSRQTIGDKAQPLVWAEGEKKTLCLDSLGFAVIGLTGCHVWNDAEANHDGDGMVWAKALKKYADRFFAGRAHVICFDSDAASNDNVLLAMRRLAGLLLETGATSVRFVRIPPDPADASRGVGIDDYMHANDEARVRALFAAAEPIAAGADVEPIAPKDPLVRLSSIAWLRGAKLPKDLRLPPRFEVRRDGSVWIEPPPDKPDGAQKEIMRGAAFPVRILESIDGEEQRVEIAYTAAGKWRRAMVDRHTTKGARKALDGLPPACAVDSNNAGNVVLWFGEYMRHNERRMRLDRFVSDCGWQNIGDDPCFLLDVPITRGKSAIVADTSGARGEALDALKPVGSLKGHKEALKAFFEGSETSAIMYLSALAATLLEPLRAPNFAVHLFGESTTGKTTRLKIAAGIFGDPRDATWVGSWLTTDTSMETRAAMFNHLPLFFDEVGSGDIRAIEKSIYMLTNGGGKGRSGLSKTGGGIVNRKTLTFKNVTMSNGEHEIATQRSNTGAQIRVVQVRSTPFEGLDRAAVDAMRDACDANHGQVGRAWIEALVAIDDWGPYVELFKSAKERFGKTASGALMQRQSVYFALMAVAEHLSHSFVGIGEEWGATVSRFVSGSSNRTEIESASDRAVDLLSSWVYSEPLTFPRLVVASGGGKITKLSKIVRFNGARDGDSVLFVPSELQARFDKAGISYAEVMSDWKARGWLTCDGPRFTKKFSVDGSRPRFVIVKASALGVDAKEASNEGADDDEWND